MARQFVRRAVTVLAVAVAPLLAVPATAHAGTNGQQIEINSYGCYYSRLWGTAYDGSDSDTGIFWLDYYGVNRPKPNYWFKGTLHVYCYDAYRNYVGLIHVEVPTWYSSDWYRVSIEPSTVETNTTGYTADPLAGLQTRQYNFS